MHVSTNRVNHRKVDPIDEFLLIILIIQPTKVLNSLWRIKTVYRQILLYTQTLSQEVEYIILGNARFRRRQKQTNHNKTKLSTLEESYVW